MTAAHSPTRSSLGGLLTILHLAVGSILVFGLLLYWKGFRWNRDAANAGNLVLEFQHKDALIRSLLTEAYQANQKQRNPELETLFRRINFSVQNPASKSDSTAQPAPAPRPATR